MYWRKANERFVRPVRWLVAMLDGEAIPLEFDGIRAGKIARPQNSRAWRMSRFRQAGAAYVDALRAAKVLGRGEREHQIRKALDAATRTFPARVGAKTNSARHGGEPHGISFGHSRQFRSAISGATGRSAGHGDA